MRLSLIAATGLGLLASSPIAAKTQLGPGDVTCATYLRDTAKDAAGTRMYRVWTTGFLSGINEYAPGPNLLRDGLDETYLDRVERACRTRPDRPLSDAIIDLTMELAKEMVDSSDPRVEIAAGYQATFKVGLAPQEPQHRLERPRRSPIGLTDPTGPGEVTIGLAPAGGAIGCAKLHVFERTASTVRFTATALRGEQTIGTTELCGPIGIDAWACLPEGTTSVRVFNPVIAKSECR